MDYKQLKDLLSRHECEPPKTPLTACITFASFGPNNKKEYPWNSRTYVISSDNKAFQPNKGGYSIFGSCLDGTDPCLRLEGLMAAECAGKDGWVVEDCGIAGYLLIESSECIIPAPKLFYSYSDALGCMLTRLAEETGREAEQVKKDYDEAKALFDGTYDSGWGASCLDGSGVSWIWKIQPACIYGAMNIVFPQLKNKSCLM